jgi:hypothetical protein
MRKGREIITETLQGKGSEDILYMEMIKIGCGQIIIFNLRENHSLLHFRFH